MSQRLAMNVLWMGGDRGHLGKPVDVSFGRGTIRRTALPDLFNTALVLVSRIYQLGPHVGFFVSRGISKIIHTEVTWIVRSIPS